MAETTDRLGTKYKSFINSGPVIKYVADHSFRHSEAEKALMEATIKKNKFYYMMGPPESLQLNANLMRTIKAKKVLEVGTFTGLSALSSALALPEDGVVHTCDMTDEHLALGRPFWKQAGVEHKIKLHLGNSLETLPRLIEEGHAETFDFAFVDAGKHTMVDDYENCLKLVRSGGIISYDNTLWSGAVADPEDKSPMTESVRKFNRHVKDDQRIHISLITMGDGLTLCFKK